MYIDRDGSRKPIQGNMDLYNVKTSDGQFIYKYNDPRSGVKLIWMEASRFVRGFGWLATQSYVYAWHDTKTNTVTPATDTSYISPRIPFSPWGSGGTHHQYGTPGGGFNIFDPAIKESGGIIERARVRAIRYQEGGSISFADYYAQNRKLTPAMENYVDPYEVKGTATFG
jgi:hypothetical protein